MDAQLIEQLDRKRCKYLFWQTVGFAAFFAGVISAPLIGTRVGTIINSFVEGLGVALFIVATVKSRRNERTIKGDASLREALDNELVKLYGYKSMVCSFYTTLITAFVLFCSSELWATLTARFACLLIIYTACLSVMIARLVYGRN